MTATHTLHAANMKIGHVRGVHDIPVSLVGTGELSDQDRRTVEEALYAAVMRVLSLAKGITFRWRPSGLTVDVYVVGHGSPVSYKAATFGVRPVTCASTMRTP